jgi:hypothetical protein
MGGFDVVMNKNAHGCALVNIGRDGARGTPGRRGRQEDGIGGWDGRAHGQDARVTGSGVGWHRGLLSRGAERPREKESLYPSRGAALLGALARSASGGILKFLGKTAKNLLEMGDFRLAGAAHLARFSRNRGLMNGLPGVSGDVGGASG